MEQVPVLPEKPTLSDFQEYIAAMVKQRGFGKETLPEKFLLFLEECGEMAKAARKYHGLSFGAHSPDPNFQHEAADVFIYLLEICNVAGIDLEEAFRAKEAINNQRTWNA